MGNEYFSIVINFQDNVSKMEAENEKLKKMNDELAEKVFELEEELMKLAIYGRGSASEKNMGGL